TRLVSRGVMAGLDRPSTAFPVDRRESDLENSDHKDVDARHSPRVTVCLIGVPSDRRAHTRRRQFIPASFWARPGRVPPRITLSRCKEKNLFLAKKSKIPRTAS